MVPGVFRRITNIRVARIFILANAGAGELEQAAMNVTGAFFREIKKGDD